MVVGVGIYNLCDRLDLDVGMPVDLSVIRYRIRDIEQVLRDLNRLTNKPFNELSIDEVYSMRYNMIMLVELLVSLATRILDRRV